MVVLVHDNPAGNARKGFLLLHEIFVEIAQGNFTGTYYILPYFGYAEAAFVIGPVLTTGGYGMGIDKYFLYRLLVGIFFFIFLVETFHDLHRVDNEYTYRFIDLRRCDPYPIGMVHRFPHIGNQLFQLRVVFAYILTYLTQNRVAISYNW